MEELIFDKIIDGASLMNVLVDADDRVGSIRDDKGKIYSCFPIDKTKNYQVKKYRALQPYAVTNYEIQVI